MDDDEYLDIAEQAIYGKATNTFICYAEERHVREGVIWITLNGIPTYVSTETGQPV